MTSADIDQKLKAIEAEFKKNVARIRKERDQKLSDLKKSIDQKAIEKLSKELKNQHE